MGSLSDVRSCGVRLLKTNFFVWSDLSFRVDHVYRVSLRGRNVLSTPPEKIAFYRWPEVQILVTHFLLLSATVSLGLLFKCRYLESVLKSAPGWE